MSEAEGLDAPCLVAQWFLGLEEFTVVNYAVKFTLPDGGLTRCKVTAQYSTMYTQRRQRSSPHKRQCGK